MSPDGDESGVYRRPSDPATRRRFWKVSAAVVPAFVVLGFVVGYISGGPSAAVALAAVFGVLLVIGLGILYRVAVV